jgi:ribosome modulation factor
MRNIDVVKTTTNRKEFNRAYKQYLESGIGAINCSRCPYHRGENRTKYYGGFTDRSVAYPNWKLVSKNRKQWMPKPLKKKIEIIRKSEFVSFKW